MATCAFQWKHQCKAVRCIAMQRAAWQRSAIQSNADRPLATAGFPGCFGPTAWLCTAVQSSAKHGMATHIKATRIVHWQQWIFRAALAQAHRGGPQGNAPQSSAAHGSSKQRGSELGNRLFSGPLWSERSAAHITASNSKPMQGNTKQRGSPTGNSGFSGPLWLTRPGIPSRFIN